MLLIVHQYDSAIPLPSRLWLLCAQSCNTYQLHRHWRSPSHPYVCAWPAEVNNAIYHVHVECKMYFRMTAGQYKMSIGLLRVENRGKIFVLSYLLFTELFVSVCLSIPDPHFAFFFFLICQYMPPRCVQFPQCLIQGRYFSKCFSDIRQKVIRKHARLRCFTIPVTFINTSPSITHITNENSFYSGQS